MKKNLSSLEIHYMLKELALLVGQKIDKIYHPDKKELLLQFHVTGKGKHILKIMAGKFLFLTELKEDASEPSGFCMFLRKYLNNTRLKAINQLESERIVEFVFETKQGNKILIIEFFGQGNILLTDENYTISSAVEYHKWKDREIKTKIKYQYPKKPVNIFNLRLKELKETINSSDKENIVKALAIDFGFGGIYSEEICLLANIEKNLKPAELNDKDIKKLLDSIFAVLKNKINPVIIYENNEAADVTPFELKIYEKNKKKQLETFSSALDSYLSLHKEVKISPKQKQIEKLKGIIGKQEKKIEELKEKEKKERQKAELIYHNYQLIHGILKEINKAAEKYSWDEIKAKLKGHKVIKEVDTKDKKIKVEIK